MKPLRGVVSTCALVLLGAGAEPVHAAWYNVFQVCCSGCGGSTVVSQYAPDPCCNPCPQQVCTTRYVQRCYYQPVTTYQTKTYYEPITTYRTSYYWEPLTSYRYSSYYDPSTCSVQQVACPTTSYRLRAQCCPVQSWLQRCCQVPVTTYQQVSYYEPVTTCCSALPPCCPTAAVATQVPAAPRPAVSEQGSAPAPGVREHPESGSSGGPSYERYFRGPENIIMPQTNGAVRRSYSPLVPVAPSTTPAAPRVRVKLEQIVATPAAQVQGQVVSQDNVPRAGTRVMFVSAALHGPQRIVSTDSAGKFRLTLASGGWLVYVRSANDRLVFYRKIEVRDNETRHVTLVSR